MTASSTSQALRVLLIVQADSPKPDAWTRIEAMLAAVPATLAITPLLIRPHQRADVTLAELRPHDSGFELLTSSLHGNGVCYKLAFEFALEGQFHIVIAAGENTEPLPETFLAVLPELADARLSAAWLTGKPGSWAHRTTCAYAAQALAQLPFHLNSGTTSFHTDLAIQLSVSNLPIRELQDVASSARRPLSDSRWGSAKAMLRWRFHQMGLLYQYNYDVRSHEDAYTPKLDYPSSHVYAIEAVAPNSVILDLGAGQKAYLTTPLRQKGCRVFAADFKPITNPEVEKAFQLDLNRDSLPECVSEVDQVMLLDIIEHLNDPEAFLMSLHDRLRDEQTAVILTTPNIAFIVTRLMLLLGQFNYGKSGILDKTHCRLFTFRSLRRSIRQCGFVIDDCRGVPAPFPKALGDSSSLARLLLAINVALIGLSKSLFSYQIFVKLRPDPTLRSVLISSDASDQSP